MDTKENLCMEQLLSKKMTPNIANSRRRIPEENDKDENIELAKKEKLPPRVYKLVWRNIMLYIALHLSALYGIYLIFTHAKWQTIIWSIVLYQLGALGITCGAHRLWSHRAYKAKFPLKAFLVFLQTLAFQDSVIDWARNHRTHHKYSDTDADPHNAKRGFFFSHVGWLLCRLHPEVREKRKGIDISDLLNDPILTFQRKYYLIIMPFVCFILPTVFPVYLWNETWHNSWYMNLFRYALTLNVSWLVNSAAHQFGFKPYDKNILPAENLGVALVALGEGWHNYHHVFPWDYKTAELGHFSTNITTSFINLMAKIGWAYDLKSASNDMIEKRIQRTGDGTHEIWGWGDKDQPQEEIKEAVIMYKDDF